MNFLANFIYGMLILPTFIFAYGLILFVLVGPILLACSYNNVYYLLLYLPIFGILHSINEETSK